MKNWPFARTWMDLEGIILSEIKSDEKDKYCVFVNKTEKKQTQERTNQCLQAERTKGGDNIDVKRLRG